jgi:transposase InsO family protein
VTSRVRDLRQDPRDEFLRFDPLVFPWLRRVMSALARVDESRGVIGLSKTEVTRRRGPWRSMEQVEFATLEWVDWFNTRRLLEPIGYVPPAEFEEAYHQQQAKPPAGLALT